MTLLNGLSRDVSPGCATEDDVPDGVVKVCTTEDAYASIYGFNEKRIRTFSSDCAAYLADVVTCQFPASTGAHHESNMFNIMY